MRIERQPAHTLLALSVLAGVGLPAAAQEDVAKQLNNPVADLISVPIQSNFDFNIGSDDGWRNTTNVQPVIPFDLSEDWLVISRTIVPVIHQDDVAGPSGSKTGLGDTVQSAFFSPRKTAKTVLGDVTWGVGPVASLPTSTDRQLGLGAWGLGPTAVALVQKGPWTYGGLTNHLWGLGYTRKRVPDLNNTFLQPFVSYTTPDSWTYSVNAEMNYNWTAKDLSGPLNFGVSKLTKLGSQLVQFQGRVRYWAADTDTSPQDLGFTLSATFVFPEK